MKIRGEGLVKRREGSSTGAVSSLTMSRQLVNWPGIAARAVTWLTMNHRLVTSWLPGRPTTTRAVSWLTVSRRLVVSWLGATTRAVSWLTMSRQLQ